MSDDALEVRFICCLHKYGAQEGPALDSEGFLVCPVHGERRNGWRSARMVMVKVHQIVKSDKPIYIARPKWGETDLQADQAIVSELFPVIEHDTDRLNRTFSLTDEEMELLGKT